MKRFLCLILCLAMLPAFPLSASAEAAELTVTFYNAADKPIDAAPLADSDDTTGMPMKKDKSAAVVLSVPEETPCAAIYLRLSVPAAKAELQKQNGQKWESVSVLRSPGAEFTIPVNNLTGKLRVQLSFGSAVQCKVLECRCFGQGDLPAWVHHWQTADEVDVLIVGDLLDAVDTALISELTTAGYTVAVAALSASDAQVTTGNRLWEAGLRIAPAVWDGKDKHQLAWWIRKWKPMLLVTAGSLTAKVEKATADALNPAWDGDSAAEFGVWALPASCTRDDDILAALANAGERSDDAIRAFCVEKFASAEHADPATIPYPETRLADGYLPEGEEAFIFEDEENGLWAYVSQTLQVQIIKYSMPKVPHTWFEAEVIFKPEAERLTQYVWVNATFEGQQIYPETLAQTSNLVFAINGDYYPYRVEKKMNVGNIIRQGKVLYNNNGKSLVYPNLDTLAIHDDGRLTVSAGHEFSADQLLAQGDIHDALSFGPYLARDGKLRIYNGDSANASEPRSALGMIEPGHYLFVMVEGKMPKGGEKGMGLVTLAELMYARGVTDAMNVDGGSTAVMLFMGRKLNRTGKGNSLGSPRNQHELFGIGLSDQVHTDMIHGKKK